MGRVRWSGFCAAVVLGLACGANEERRTLEPNPPASPVGAPASDTPSDTPDGGTDPADPPEPDGGTIIGADAGTSPTDADCLPEVEVGEGIEEPDGGWGKLIQLPAGYTDPELISPKLYPGEPSCISLKDERPPIADSCMQIEWGANGQQLFSTTSLPYAQLHPEPTPRRHEPGRFVTTYVPCAGCDPYILEATFDSEGRLIEKKETDTYDGRVVTHWRMRFACDGRPVRYDALVGTAPASFLYDSQGRPTRIADESGNSSESRSWHANGQLRARMTWRNSEAEGATYETAQLFDDAGRLIAEQESKSESMGETVVTTIHDRAGRRSWSAMDWPRHNGWWVTLRADVLAPDGSWLFSEKVSTVRDPSAPRERSVLRNTLSCEMREPVRGELDRDGDGTFDEVFTYEWSPVSPWIRTTPNTDGGWFEYRFDCSAYRR